MWESFLRHDLKVLKVTRQAEFCKDVFKNEILSFYLAGIAKPWSLSGVGEASSHGRIW